MTFTYIFFLSCLPKEVPPEASVSALKVLIALINTDELRCKAFVDISLLYLRGERKKKHC